MRSNEKEVAETTSLSKASAPDGDAPQGVRSSVETSSRRSRPIPTPAQLENYALAAILLLGVLTFVPAVFTTFFLDDHVHTAMIEGRFPGQRRPFDLYNFIDDQNRAELYARGFLPWWADPTVTIRFLRPLGSLLVWADHVTFGEHALPMHLHSLLWWGAAVLAARALFARAFTPRVVLFATAIFALSPSHAVPLAWIANRESLMSTAFGAVALGLVTRRVPGPGPTTRAALAASVLYALAFVGGGEYALAFGGYAVAIEFVRRRLEDGAAARLRRLLPFVAPAATYLVVRHALGYGAEASGFYSDPIGDPIGFLTKLPVHALVLLGDGWLTLDAEHWAVSWAVLGLALTAAAIVFAVRTVVVRTIAELEPNAADTARWLLWGSFLAMIPGLAAVPHARLLGIAMLGIAPVVALVLEKAWFSDARPERRGYAELVNVVALALGFAHLVHGPVTSWLAGRKLQKDAAAFERLAKRFTPWMEGERAGASPAEADVAVVRGTSSVYFMPFALGRSELPKRWRVLAQTGHVLVQRIDEHTLDVIASRGAALYPPGEPNLFRDDRRRLEVGETIVQGDMTATVREVGDLGPRIVRFTFADPEALVWVSEKQRDWETVSLPTPGFGAPFNP